MIISSILLFSLKLIYFVLFPIGLVVRALEMNPTRFIDPHKIHESLILCAINYILISIFESAFSSEVALWFLILLVLGTQVARRKGKVKEVFGKVVELSTKQKKKQQ